MPIWPLPEIIIYPVMTKTSVQQPLVFLKIIIHIHDTVKNKSILFAMSEPQKWTSKNNLLSIFKKKNVLSTVRVLDQFSVWPNSDFTIKELRLH